MDALEILQEARMRMVIQNPFFGTLSIYLGLVEDTAIQTCATDGEKFYFNSGWVEGIYNNAPGNNPDERRRKGYQLIKGVIAHEVMHAALSHVWRRGDRYAKAWNIACDYAINWILKEAGMELPEGVLYDQQYADLPAEEIYARFKLDNIKELAEQLWGSHSKWEEDGEKKEGREQEANERGGGGGEGNEDQEEMSGMDYTRASALAEEWASRAATAAQQAMGRGDLPASLKRLIDQSLEPRISWREILAEFLQPRRTDYTYFPVDRRFVHSETYIPDFGGMGIEDIVIVYDTSGSISDDILTKFSAEAKGILSMHGRSRVHIVSCDAQVHTWETLEGSDDWPTIEPQGGGGTDFRPVFEEIGEKNILPSVVVFLTDGDGWAPNDDPGYPVLWVLTPDGNIPCNWGRTIKMLD
jgi:predicted metal-dependent peptidase